MVLNPEVLTDKGRDTDETNEIRLTRLDRITLTDRIIEQEIIRDWLRSSRINKDMNSGLISSAKV
jgi:hypothetical protein